MLFTQQMLKLDGELHPSSHCAANVICSADKSEYLVIRVHFYVNVCGVSLVSCKRCGPFQTVFSRLHYTMGKPNN